MSHDHDHGLGEGHGHDHAPARHDRAFAIGTALNLAFVALTAHLVMPDGGGDEFLQRASGLLGESFDIEHMTLQVVRRPFCQPCEA